jgi:hypothetical protein
MDGRDWGIERLLEVGQAIETLEWSPAVAGARQKGRKAVARVSSGKGEPDIIFSDLERAYVSMALSKIKLGL